MSSPLNYREFAPWPSLAGSLDCFWASSISAASRAPLVHRVLPDGCIDLLFDFTAAGDRRATVIGTMTRALAVTTSGLVDLLGVRFRPGGLSGLIRFNAAELTDTRVDLGNFLGPQALELWHRLGEAAPADRIPLLQESLAARGRDTLQVDPFVRHCVSQIEAARGGLRVCEHAESTGLSTRQVERKFARHIGVGPKAFARIVRFKAVEQAAAAEGAKDWARLAADLGFADQSHLAREFRAFSGLTLTEFTS